MIDNVFITDFLPAAPDLCVKAYILGLMKCNSADESENTLDYFATTLKVCEEDVISLFKYWEDLGLVQVLSTTPVEIRFLPLNTSKGNVRKFKVDKYTDFNIQIQELFKDRMVMPNEFAEFYNLIERHHFEEKALIEIVKYCIDYKGFNLSPNYCLIVAKDWERDGVRTKEQVEEKIKELGVVDDKMNLVLSQMGSKRKVQIEDKGLINKWLNYFGFDINVIIFVVKLMKSKNRHMDVNILDEMLMRYYEMKLLSIQEIENYENEKENLYSIAKAINKELGIYYEDMSKEIDTYVVSWINMGFDMETLVMVADNCFKSSIRTLEGYNTIILKLFKLGITSKNSYLQYLNEMFTFDEKIKNILSVLGLTRNITNMDRNFYSIWTKDWGFSDEIILYTAEIAKSKGNSIQYLNRILSNWNSEGIKSIDMAKNVKIDNTSEGQFIHNNYSKEQIASLISNLDEVEV